jgi:retron-type reverse transcriptase
MRPLAISSLQDRIVQEAMRNVLEAVLAIKFLDCSFGNRPGRGCHSALAQIRNWEGVKWFVKGEIKEFFNNIDYKIIEKLLRRHFNDERLIHLY